MNVIQSLKSLYETPSHHRAARERTLAPLARRVTVARDELAALRAEHYDMAREAMAIDVRALARFIRPELLPVIGRLVEAARVVVRPDSIDEVVDDLFAAKAFVDAELDRTYEASVQILIRDLDRLEGNVRAMRASARVVVDILNTLAAAEALANEAVVVPPLQSHNLPIANAMAKSA